jgi:hypothetical protein
MLGACGGSATHTSSTTSTAAAGTTTTTPARTPSSLPSVKVLTELVRRVSNDSPGPYRASVSPQRRDVVDFATVLPHKGPAIGSLKVSVQRGPGTALTVTASGGGHTATATVKSPDGKPLTLLEPRYPCQVPPTPTYCPALGLTTGGNGDTLSFKPSGHIPIVVVATVGPLVGESLPASHPSAVKQPPYTVSAQVRDATSAVTTGHAAPFESSVSVHGGDTISVRALITGKAGASQSVTVHIPKGPSKRIAVTASVPGGAPSQATITSADNTPLSLDHVRYSCFVPPSPTFCPAQRLHTAAKGYTLVFPGAPDTPVVVSITVGASNI